MSETEELGFKHDPNKCGGCQIGEYSLKHGIKHADSCRWCENINMQHPELKLAIIKDKYFKNHVYCKTHKILMLNYETCNYFKKSS